MQRCSSIVALSFWPLALASSASPSGDSVEIAPGVVMPLMNLGGVTSKPSNFSLWLELGGRGLDTAFEYGAEVQSSVGRAARGSGLPLSDLFITTKVPCCPDDQSFFNYGCSGFAGVAPDEVVRAALAADLEQLGLDRVDLLLLHMPCNTLEQTVAAYLALEGVQASGKARAIGVSNFNSSFLAAFLPRVSVTPAVNQCGFSIGGHSEPLHGRDLATVQQCHEAGITYSAYSPLGGLDGIDVFHNPDVLAVAAAHGRSAAQVALRWVVQQGIPAVTASDNGDHDKADLDVFSFELTEEEMARLTASGLSRASIMV